MGSPKWSSYRDRQTIPARVVAAEWRSINRGVRVLSSNRSTRQEEGDLGV